MPTHNHSFLVCRERDGSETVGESRVSYRTPDRTTTYKGTWWVGEAGSSWGHNHTFTGTQNTHNHTFTGTSFTFDNNPPYKVAYCYKRIS